jgi:hypothetical protein
LAGLAVLGGLLPLIASGPVSTYAAVFPPGGEAVARLGPGWRVMRVLAVSPVPILLVAHEAAGGAWPAALLIPVPGVAACDAAAGR